AFTHHGHPGQKCGAGTMALVFAGDEYAPTQRVENDREDVKKRNPEQVPADQRQGINDIADSGVNDEEDGQGNAAECEKPGQNFHAPSLGGELACSIESILVPNFSRYQ